MASTIQIKRGTGSAVPSGLADGELAINLDSGKLYFGSGSTSVDNFTFGELTAEKYIVSSSVLYVTTSFSSGSTEFGDTADDTHTFTGNITASGNISASGDIIGQNFTAHDIISTSFTGSVDNPAIRLGPLSGNLTGNKVGIMLEDAVPNNKLFIPWFVSNGAKVFGFGGYMDMQMPIYMGNNKIVFDGDVANTFIYADTSTPENLEIHADGNIELRAQDDLQVYSDVDVTGEITASGNISASGTITANAFVGNITGDLTGEAATVATIAGLAPNTATTQATQGAITSLGTLTGLNVNSHITASGNISASNIVYGEAFYAHGNVVGLYHPASTTIRLAQAGKSTSIYGSDITMGAPVTSSYHISTSANVYAADYFDNGTNISSIYSPIASPTFTGTVAIPNIANVETAITANTAKATNVSTNLTATTHASQITINSSDGDNVVIAEASDTIAGVMTVAHHDKLDGIEASATADQTQADINGLAITTVGALGSGTIASGFGNIDNGSSTIDTGEITATSIKHSISGNNAGEYGPGAEILYGISSETTTAGVIYTLRNGVWTQIDASTDNTVYNLCAVAVGTNSSTDGMLIKGCVTLASAYTAGSDSEGIPVYASETAGQATLTAPSDSGDLVRILGYSLNVSSKKMFFNPDSTYVEIA